MSVVTNLSGGTKYIQMLILKSGISLGCSTVDHIDDVICFLFIFVQYERLLKHAWVNPL